MYGEPPTPLNKGDLESQGKKKGKAFIRHALDGRGTKRLAGDYPPRPLKPGDFAPSRPSARPGCPVTNGAPVRSAHQHNRTEAPYKVRNREFRNGAKGEVNEIAKARNMYTFTNVAKRFIPSHERRNKEKTFGSNTPNIVKFLPSLPAQ